MYNFYLVVKIICKSFSINRSRHGPFHRFKLSLERSHLFLYLFVIFFFNFSNFGAKIASHIHIIYTRNRFRSIQCFIFCFRCISHPFFSFYSSLKLVALSKGNCTKLASYDSSNTNLHLHAYAISFICRTCRNSFDNYRVTLENYFNRFILVCSN